MVLLFAIRVLLSRENERRDAEPPDNSYDDVYVARIAEEGKRVEVKVSKVRVRSRRKALKKIAADVIVRTGVLGFD
jgi:hypothetical protein